MSKHLIAAALAVAVVFGGGAAAAQTEPGLSGQAAAPDRQLLPVFCAFLNRGDFWGQMLGQLHGASPAASLQAGDIVQLTETTAARPTTDGWGNVGAGTVLEAGKRLLIYERETEPVRYKVLILDGSRRWATILPDDLARWYNTPERIAAHEEDRKRVFSFISAQRDRAAAASFGIPEDEVQPALLRMLGAGWSRDCPR